MRIAFVSANQEDMPDRVLPIGLLYVMANIPSRHEKALIDLCFEKDPTKTLGEKLMAFQPDLVAIGLRNIQNSDYSGTQNNIRYYQSLIAAVRSTTQAPIVLGGGGFSVIAAGLMETLRPDFGIAGEGEENFPLLLQALETKTTDFSTIPSLYYFQNNLVKNNPAREGFLTLDALNPPDRSQLDPRYYSDAAIDSLQTKRGCPLKCEYCTYPIIEGKSIRQRDPEAIVDEFFQAIEAHHDLKHFFVVDSVFNLPPKHAKAICRAMIRRNFKTPWTCYANPLGFDEELAELMAQAHCVGMEIGSDSGCDDVLDNLKKGFSTTQIREISALSKEAGLKDCHTFILGTRGETLDHVFRTLDFIIDMNPYAAILMVYTDDDEAINPEIKAQRKIFKDEILNLLQAKKLEFPRWIIPPLGTNFDRRLFAMLRRQGLSGPLWQHITLADGDASESLPNVGRLAHKAPTSVPQRPTASETKTRSLRVIS